MFYLTISRALLIAGLNLAGQVASFSPSTPFSARNHLPTETLLSTPSKVPRKLTTQLLAGNEPKVSKALRGLFGCPNPWRGVFPPQHPDEVNLFTLGIVHRRYKWKKFDFKTKITLTDSKLGDVLTNAQLPIQHESSTRSNGTPFQAQSLKTSVNIRADFNAMIKNVGGSFGGNHESFTDVFGIRRMVRGIDPLGEDDLVQILSEDALGPNLNGNGPQEILRFIRRRTGEKKAKRIVIVTAVIIADLAASTGTTTGVNAAANVPLLGGGGFDFSQAENLASYSQNQVVLAKYVGWNYDKQKPLAPGNFEIYKMD